MVICPDCGREVPEANYCENCAAYIKNINIINENTSIKYCINCGEKIQMTDNYCHNCGYNLKK
ncbi:MAG: zinc-ribbon domain-containing protein [Methanobrevibacter thaueri]|nr:zinc-ribbon domain-containing protein [Methanobrevibacter thaueri]